MGLSECEKLVASGDVNLVALRLVYIPLLLSRSESAQTLLHLHTLLLQSTLNLSRLGLTWFSSLRVLGRHTPDDNAMFRQQWLCVTRPQQSASDWLIKWRC
jgi:hypothetical protein